MKSLVLLLTFILSVEVSAKPECVETRAALDIGSGSSKALVAVVNTCEKYIQSVLYEGDRAVGFANAAEKSSDGKIPSAVVDEGEARIRELLLEIKKHNPQSIKAVATSVFRTAKNGNETAVELSKRLGLEVKIITQDEEAELGLAAALGEKKAKPSDSKAFIVWDIGGGSMQMIARDGKKTEVFKGLLAAVSFKNRVIKEIQKKEPATKNSPNPLGAQAYEAVSLAQNEAASTVPKFFVREGANSARWIGIGGVLAKSVQMQIAPGKKEFDQNTLNEALASRSKLSDDQIVGHFKDTEITNLALVLGFMKALKINKVETANVSLNQGLVLR